MSSTEFELLLQKVDPLISKKDTKWRQAVPSKHRLAMTLRFLATGDSYKSMQYLFKISNQVIGTIVPEVCEAIIQVLKREVKLSSTENDWLQISEGFRNIFPHCCGAFDGKHVVLESLIHSGSDYINYKKTFSVVLLALVDKNYLFLFADIGCQGRMSDGGVLQIAFYGKILIIIQ
uniref:DDE Tnp4 domain-containing protein n=1 Tax=Bombyx mori TaxID=7091 RepID=A0A8R2DKW8_BOMMO|nr:uncharacterized protein LOC110384797 [Bombyx mori]